MRLLSLRAVNPEKYALTLMDAIFDDQEMGNCCFSRGNRAKKPALPASKVKLIEGILNNLIGCHYFIATCPPCTPECIDKKFGKRSYIKNMVAIVRKCNQKCLDANRRAKNRDVESPKVEDNCKVEKGVEKGVEEVEKGVESPKGDKEE